jgi:hypothetical protein
MARVPIPQQGQPLDLAYISTLATAVNQLSEEGAALAQGNNFIIQGRSEETPASYRLYGAQVYAKQVTVTSGPSTPTTLNVSFSPYNFSTPPVVTATLIDSTDAHLSLKDITSSSVTLVVTFSTTETNTAQVSLIAVGIPSSV